MNDLIVPGLTSSHDWPDLKEDKTVIRLLETAVLPPYINGCRWFAGKARQQDHFAIRVIHEIPLPGEAGGKAYLLIVGVRYADGETENYQLPLAFIPDRSGPSGEEIPPKGIIAPAAFGGQSGQLVDGIYFEPFRLALFEGLAGQHTLPQEAGQLVFHRGKGLAEEDGEGPVLNRVLPVDSSNSALVFGPGATETRPGGEKYFMKLYRKLFQETNPEVDMVSFLTETGHFAHIPAYAGSLVWHRDAAGPEQRPEITLGMMQLMVENQKDSWALTGDYLNDFLYAVPNRMFSVREDVFDMVELLGKRSGQMHLALYKPEAGPAFAPEPFSEEYREFMIRRVENLLERRYNLLIDNYTKLEPLAQRLAWVFMEAKEMIDAFIDDFRKRPLKSARIRIHGDYHLGQVLATGQDFIIIDFEGEPESSIAERKIKHSPLKDVAGMIRSYHYAVCAKLFNSRETEGIEPDHLQRVSDRWFKLIRDTYMDAYLDVFGNPHPLFGDSSEVNFLLLVYLLEKAVYELGYEISYRPAWVNIPLKGIVDVIREIEKIRSGDPNADENISPLPMGLLQTKKE
ncbi:putative maltokinase [Larkinella soli]|uniref:putative maltokinase n=1 Tax=Larkinella soli TaxID=1770527 RepID=UPI000FFC2733|nr:putative maltokinase [Larkinella soli]